ncbi:MAG TPA: ATP-binding protein [Anaerolineales bacterium]|nr:ATP-binding protein [Anaerolineales bacterium]
MTTQVACPRCGQLVDPQERECPHCGVALGFAAALFEQSMTSLISIDTSTPITPEILVPRLGEYLIEKGVLSQEQLHLALEHSKGLASRGEHRLVGQALLELRMVEREMLDQVVTEQILQLQYALQQSNRKLEERVHERTRELQSALSKLAELNQLKSNFIANVSHELRTPLTHIKGYLDLMSDDGLGPLTEEQNRALKVMVRSELRLEALIEELILFSMASSDTFLLRLDQMKLIDLVQMALSKVWDKADARHVRLREHIPDTSLVVNVDRDKMRYVLIELLDNAIKFTPEGGVVRLVILPEDSLVSISVQDTGIGIAQDRIKELFEPFHQLDGSVTRRYEGVGLGLALVNKIIEAHGSSIDVSSVEGKGSQFQFRLPLLNVAMG